MALRPRLRLIVELGLRSCYDKQLPATTRMHYQFQRHFSQSHPSRAQNNKIYELRTYCVNPKDLKPFVELSKEWMHVRTGHSKLVGYWTAELGTGINDMVHIWEYESLAQRATVRKNLAGDPEWVGNYFSKILPWLQRQENTVLKCLPGTDITYPTENGVYELMFMYMSKSPEETANQIKSLSRPGTTLLGSWYGALSLPNFGWLLWFHNDINSTTESPLSVTDESGIRLVQSKVLLPTPWSTMK